MVDKAGELDDGLVVEAQLAESGLVAWQGGLRKASASAWVAACRAAPVPSLTASPYPLADSQAELWHHDARHNSFARKVEHEKRLSVICPLHGGPGSNFAVR